MPEEQSDFQELDSLLAQLVDGTLDDQAFAELEAHLEDNPTAQDRYLRYLSLIHI